MDQSAIELYEENPTAICALQVHSLDPDQDAVGTQALVLLQREGGILLAVPAGAFSEEILNAAAEGDPFLAYGAHANFIIRLVSPPEGLQGEEAEVTVIDTELNALAHLNRLPDPVPPEVLTFGADPFMLPDVVPLMQFTRDWVAQCQEGQQLAYYSAVEEEQANGLGGETPKVVPVTQKSAAKQKAKRVTTASLADQLAELSAVLPSLTQQLQVLQQGQDELRCRMDAQASAPPPQPSQMPVSAPLQSFAKMLGSPPRTRAAGALQKPLPSGAPMTTTEMVDGEEVEKSMPGGGALAQAVLEQSRALTSLVSQLSQGGDPLLDGHQGSSAISLGSRGAQWREKLQLELASRSGGFFLSVLRNAYKRMKPAARVPTSIQAAQGLDMSMVNYLERFGGYGQSREMGLVQWNLGHIFDCALQEDLEGVREHVALLMTAVEQAVQDNSRWDLAYQLTLSQLWAYRHAVTQSRLRACAPLCAQRWATIALAYAKEVDYIQNRKVELTKKQPTQPAHEGDPKAKPKPKRKPKWHGGGAEGSGSKNESEA